MEEKYISKEELLEIYNQIISGKNTLTDLATEFGVHHTTLKEKLMKVLDEEQKEMLNNILKQNSDRGTFIDVTDEVREEILKVLNREIELKEAAKNVGMSDKTLKFKIKELAAVDPEINVLYMKFEQENEPKFENYSFRIEIIEMLYNDITQDEIAARIGAERPAISRAIRNLPDDDLLKKMCIENGQRHKSHERLSTTELEQQRLVLDEYRKTVPISEYKRDERHPIEKEIEKIKRIFNYINQEYPVQENGKRAKSLKEICKEIGISEANLRRYRKTLELDEKILELNIEITKKNIEK